MGRKEEKSFRKVVVLIVVLAIMLAVIVIKNNEKKAKNEIAKGTVANNTIETSTEPEEKQEEKKEEGSKKIDFLADLKVPVYKKNEKNIKIPVLIYHAFAEETPPGDIYNLFSTTERFEENVKTLLDDGYTFITLDDIDRYNKGEIGLPEKNITITIDDGFIGCYTVVYPILKKYNVPATIFVINSVMDTADYFDWDQAKEMYDSGLVKIHCHGYNHLDCTTLTKERLVSEYNKSHEEIIEHLGEEVTKIMAYPAGKSSANTIQWLKEAGFNIQIQTRYGTVNTTKTLDMTNIGRIRGEKASGKQILSVINSAGL